MQSSVCHFTRRVFRTRFCWNGARNSNSSVAKAPLLETYKEKVLGGFLQYDEKQYQILQHFSKLQYILEQPIKSEMFAPPADATGSSTKLAELRRLRGLYLYGSVGTGKTMLMDSFYNSTTINSKRRVHFHDFMLEVHGRIHKHKKKLIEQFGRDIHINMSSERDSIVTVAQDIAAKARLLCFDEFQVTDICDAMILSRLFGELWRAGVVLVATSNRGPEELYQGGLNRHYFLPFIQQLQAHCLVRDIGAGADYRQRGQQREGAFYVPSSAANRDRLWARFQEDLGGLPARQETVPVMMGRTLTLAAASLQRGVCFVSFAELCEREVGAADYQALCAHFGTVYMHGIPELSVLAHNEARRMITLVDALYNSHVRFVWAAQAPPAQLFRLLSAQEAQEVRNMGAASAPLGTDHSWAGQGVASSREPAGTPKEEEEEQQSQQQHLRGGEQRRLSLSLPLDSNVFFGTTLTLRPSSPPAMADAAAVPPYGGGTSSSCNTDSSVAAPPVDAAQEELKVLEGELASIRELGFAFRRAASRLTEMASVEYELKWRSLWHGKHV